MAEINCPMCGKPNPATRDVCQYCEARLKPLTDELSRSQPPIRPGEEPTDMDTGQLESVLPQWLRDIRQQARESASEEEDESPPQTEQTRQPEERSDLLAGLRSQSEGDEEIPDWLSGLRSEGGQVNFEGSSSEEDDLAALKSMLGDEAPVSQEGEETTLPAWMSNQGADETEQAGRDELSAFFSEGSTEEPAQTEFQSPSSGSDFAWDADFGTESTPEAGATEGEASMDTELPAWLRDTDQGPQEEAESNLPAWLRGEPPSLPADAEEATSSGEGDLPSWLASLGEEETGETPPSEDFESSIKSTTDWLASLGEEETGTVSQQEAALPATEGNIPDWLSTLGEESAETIAPQETEEPVEAGDLPGWLAALGEESGETALPEEQVEPLRESETPAWLSSLEDESPAEETGQPVEEPELLSSISEMRDETADAPPTFVDDEGEPISSEDVEAIFSMDMPDWLSEAGDVSKREATLEQAEAEADELRPAELPSWVQAMRPVESVISETEGTTFEEQPIEERGPLAGLRGVLPAVPGVGPSSKPKAYSFKLQASEDQMANAAMLERMLAEEVHPEPVDITQKAALTERILRWVIAALLILVVVASVFYSPQINPIPTLVPPETSDALNYLNNGLPTNAPVLLVFDFEPARAAEMEAAAAPLVDQMITLKAPRLIMVASTPTGSGLAEHFMNILQADRTYTRNENFINLGYLPGGAAGVQAFSGDPVGTKPFTTTGEGAWTTPVLEGVDQLSGFAAILLLTDDVETARIWIEQTQNNLGETRFLVVSSAQTGPMLLPYARSGQVDGMVTGLASSAPIEQANSGRPGMARRYWDAFGFGLLAAALMIGLGSLWSIFSSLQAVRKEQGKG